MKRDLRMRDWTRGMCNENVGERGRRMFQVRGYVKRECLPVLLSFLLRTLTVHLIKRDGLRDKKRERESESESE